MSILKIVLALVFIGGIAAYSIFNSRIFIAGPEITISEPQNGSLIEGNPLIQVSGSAKNISKISINDRKIYTDENSYFQESVLLNPGYNIIQIKAEDKFGREEIDKLEVVYSGEKKSISDIEIVEGVTEILEATSSTSSENY
jgi:hypothetical protein